MFYITDSDVIWRHGGLMVSVLDSGSNSLGVRLVGDTLLTVPLSNLLYKWVPVNFLLARDSSPRVL